MRDLEPRLQFCPVAQKWAILEIGLASEHLNSLCIEQQASGMVVAWFQLEVAMKSKCTIQVAVYIVFLAAGLTSPPASAEGAGVVERPFILAQGKSQQRGQNAPTTTATSICGNNVVEASEVCDGTDFGSASCAGLGYAGGALSCTSNCTLDLSACIK